MNDIIGITILILGLFGLSLIYLLRKREENIQKLNIQKFNFCLLQNLYLDSSNNNEIFDIAEKIEKSVLIKKLLSEIEKSKNNKSLLEKLYKIFDDLDLIDFELMNYRNSNIPEKAKIISDLSLVKTEKVKNILLSILERNESYQIVLETGKVLVDFMDENVFLVFVVNTLNITLELSEKIVEVVCEYASKLPNAELREEKLDKNLRNEIYNKYLTLLFDERNNYTIASAYTLGYFKFYEACEFILDRLNTSTDSDVLIQLIRALRKIGCIESAEQIYRFILDKSDMALIQEALSTLKTFGKFGEKFLTSLSDSKNQLLSVLAQSYLSS